MLRCKPTAPRTASFPSPHGQQDACDLRPVWQGDYRPRPAPQVPTEEWLPCTTWGRGPTAHGPGSIAAAGDCAHLGRRPAQLAPVASECENVSRTVSRDAAPPWPLRRGNDNESARRRGGRRTPNSAGPPAAASPGVAQLRPGGRVRRRRDLGACRAEAGSQVLVSETGSSASR